MEAMPIKLVWDDPVWGHELEDMDGRSMATAQMRPFQAAKGRRHLRETEVLVSTQRDRLEMHLTPEQLVELEAFMDAMARDNARLLALKLASLMERPLVQENAEDRQEDDE